MRASYWRTNLALGAGFIFIVGGFFLYSRSMSSDLIETMALEEARHYSNVLVEFRTLYSKEVVEKLRGQGIEARRDFHSSANAIPLPATLTKLLGRSASEAEPAPFKLYSPYPFPGSTGHSLSDDSYANEAWDFLNENPALSFSRVESINGVSTLRYATADRMRAECVHCHNNHPESPRTGWREGDVRGVLEVAVPLAPGVSVMDSRLRDMVVFSIFFLGLVAWSLAATIQKSRKNYLGLLGEREYSDEITASMTDALIVVDPRGAIATVNKAAMSLLGWAEHDLVGRPLGSFLGPSSSDITILSDRFEQLRLEMESVYSTDDGYLMSELSMLPVGITGQVAGSSNLWCNKTFGRLTGWEHGTLSSGRLGDNKEEAGKDDQLGEWVVTDAELLCRDGSSMSVGTVRLPINHSPGCTFSLYFNEHDLRAWPIFSHVILSTLRRFRNQRVIAEQLEIDMLTAEGNTIPVLLGGAKLLSQNQEHGGTVLVIKDMTTVRKSEQEREESKLQLFAQSRLASLGQVAAGVAHEINNPLTFIKAYLAILEDDAQKWPMNSERGSSLLPEATRQVERIRKIVQHMQRVGRKSSGRWTRVFMEDVLNSSLVLLQERVDANAIQIRRHIVENLPAVECCADSLEQLMVNLLVNSMDSLEEVARERIIDVSMSLNDDGKFMVIEFSDNGIGISKSDQLHIFDPFFTTKEVGKGTGLGLSLSYAIARDHQGDLQCKSDMPQGVIMRFTLPVNRSV